MKQYAIIYCALIWFISAPLFAAHSPVRSHASVEQASEKEIVQVHLSLEESLADLSRVFGVKIEIFGKSLNVPAKFNLNVKQATLVQAVKEAIRKAGIQNHALVWDEPNKTLRLLIFETGKSGIISVQNKAVIDLYNDDMNPLTQEQLYFLAQQSEKTGAEEQENRKPLTLEQLQELQEQGAKIGAEEQENRKPLTLEQLQKLKDQNAKIESQENENMKPLTKEQLLLLQDWEAQNLPPLFKDGE